MAAEIAVLVSIGSAMASGLCKTVLEKSVDALSKTSSAAGLKSAIFGSLKPQLLDLKQELLMLNALLCSAESLNPVQQKNVLMLLWLGSIRKAVNYADNVLDDISYDQMRRQAESNVVTKLLCGSDDNFAFRAKIGRKLSKFMSMTADIYKKAAEYGIRPAEFSANPSSYQPTFGISTDLREMRENVDTSIVVGRQSDEALIVGELSRPNNDQVLGVIALVGMSGVGKTTLARKVYDSETVTLHYKKRVWIFVSEDFNLRRLLDEMLQSVSGENHNLYNIDAMEKKLKGCLGKERYLLVLDDVWNTDKRIWDSVRTSLVRITDGCTGTMVLVTTQNSEVASVMGASLTHIVKVLSDDDAWTLFEKNALANRSQEQVLDLRDVGERILSKCGGLPLAINTVGSLLCSMNERSEWESVERSQLWNQTEIMPWLLLSFNHLPSAAVKQCFAHCSVVIPKGYSVKESRLFQCWIAQGFIRALDTSCEAMVAIGRMYLKTMVAAGLLLFNISRQQYSMHDLVHVLAQYVSRDTCLVIGNSTDLHKASSSGAEHVVVHGWNTWNSQENFPDANAQSVLRTLFCINAAVSIELVAQARFLRHLQLIGCGLKEIPSSVGRLKHLRILDLSGNPFEYLPGSIGRLHNLQILSLHRCHRLAELPHQVTKLLNLMFIPTSEAVDIPKGMGRLTELRELPVIKLKAREGFKIKELRSLLHLDGEVVIKQLENISCKEDAMEAGLKMKEGITHLKLIWTNEGHDDDTICGNDERVMEGLQPHSKLKCLWLENFRGKTFPPWLSDGLYCKNLMELHLRLCKRCEQLPTLGCLPFLGYLHIYEMESIEIIGSEFFYTCDQMAAASSGSGSSNNDPSKSSLFPQLKKLLLSNMPKLKDWFDPSVLCASAFPCLAELCIKNCPLLASVPACFHFLKQLSIDGINSSQPLLTILSNNSNLTSLVIENVHQLVSLSDPLLKCTSLQLLKIIDCGELAELPPTLQSLSYLQTLEIIDCNSLTSLPIIKDLLSLSRLEITGCENITNTPCGLESCVSIERLELVSCPKLTFIPDLASLNRLRVLFLICFSKQMSVPQWLNHLSCLSELAIGVFNMELDNFRGINNLPKCLGSLTLLGWPELKGIPNELQSCTQLQTLGLFCFEGVIELPEWLGNLSSLQLIGIKYCENMKHLPSLDAMRKLSQLRYLEIEDCPLLEERCRKDGGEEWHKISHISNIEINGETVE